MEDHLFPEAEALSTLDACVMIEEACAKMYRYFALLFRNNVKIAQFWAEMAEEEDQHAGEFRRAIAAHGRAPECLDSDNHLIEGIIANLDALMIKMKRQPPLPREAFLTAAIVEHSVEKYHVETGKLLVNAELAGLLSAMAHSSLDHQNLLLKMA
jgi:rubrerythrin